LQTAGVFAINCQIFDSAIYPGLLIIDDFSLCGQVVELIQPLDAASEKYKVQLPDQGGMWTIPVDGRFSIKRVYSNAKTVSIQNSIEKSRH
jgi:hypothetical protein